MTTLTEQQFADMLTYIVGNESFCKQFKEKLGMGLGPEREKERDKSKVLLDDHTFRRLEKFTGAEGTWQEWSFNMSMTITQVDPKLGEALDEIRLKSKSPISADMFDVESSPFTKIDDDMLKSYSAALYGVMCSLTGGEANAIVRNVSQKLEAKKCGFIAFYALNVRFNPRTPARKLQFFAQVVSPVQVKNVREVPMAIEKWEAKNSILGSEYGEDLSKELKTAILISLLPNELQDMVYQTQEGEIEYSKVRDKVVSLASYRIQMASPTPMDIGAVNSGSTHCNHEHEQSWNQDVNNWHGESELDWPSKGLWQRQYAMLQLSGLRTHCKGLPAAEATKGLWKRRC